MTSPDSVVLITFIAGVIIVGIGLSYILPSEFDPSLQVGKKYDLDKEYDKSKICSYKEIRCLSFVGEHIPFSFADGTSGMVDFRIELTTFDVWSAGNQINYTMVAQIDHSERIDALDFLILQPNEDINNITGKNLADFLSFYNKTASIIHLVEADKNLFIQQSNFNSTNEEDVSLLGVIRKGNQADILMSTGTVVHVGPYLEKLQAETNRALLKNIAESQIINDRIVGLTIVGIGLVPLAMALQVIIDRKNKQ